MKHAKLLDCTLRDGAYLVDKEFGDNYIHGIIQGLINAHIDIIEIGFLQDEGFGEGKTVYKNAADAKRFIPIDKQGVMFTVLADFSRYSVENLDRWDGESIDAIRECFFKDERFEALKVCEKIKEKGYKLFIQPVDILGYTDIELIEYLDLVNKIEPYCFSIVDTFGSMYQEDLHRVFEIINHNLISTAKIGFHSHNNMQLSNALSQEFVRMTYGKREIIVDCTLSGMGRGAGNTPTELIMQYMVSKLSYNYEMDVVLDIIDGYMDNIRSRCTWGYTTPYFVAGCHSAHVNNIAYLTDKNSIHSKDIRHILSKMGTEARKRYDYELLEKMYVEYLTSDIDDTDELQYLSEILAKRDVVILVPGSSVGRKQEEINQYIRLHNAIVISVNFIHENIEADYVYVSNVRRYNYWKNSARFIKQKKIITSNIKQQSNSRKELIISFNKLIKCGWDHMDNSTLMLLRLLDMLEVNSIAIAGFDGYSYHANVTQNYVMPELELSNVLAETTVLNKEIADMLKDYAETRKHHTPITFITESRFDDVF